MMNKSYSELSKLKTFDERFEYLRLKASIGEILYGYERYLNQLLYTSTKWRKVRRKIILRDEGNDLGVPDHPIFGPITVHHINPLTIKQLEEEDPAIFDEENLISVSDLTHKFLHYGKSECPQRSIYGALVERRPGDTCPWKGG